MISVSLNFFKCLFWERESTCSQVQEEQREMDRIPSRLPAVSSEPNTRLDFMNHVIMTWAKIKGWVLNRISHPGSPQFSLFKFDNCYIAQSIVYLGKCYMCTWKVYVFYCCLWSVIKISIRPNLLIVLCKSLIFNILFFYVFNQLLREECWHLQI